MAQLLKPQNVKIVTKDGEIVISLQLDININLNQLGAPTVSSGVSLPEQKTTTSSKQDDVAWEIPDFGPTEKIKFGK
jgi:hypothetical protein